MLPQWILRIAVISAVAIAIASAAMGLWGLL